MQSIKIKINKYIMIEDISDNNYQSMDAITRRPKSTFSPIKREVSSSLQLSTSIQLTESDRQCRICLDNDFTSQNQLVAPCKCTGTVKYVHDRCFRQWIEKQYAQKNKRDQAQFLKIGVQCELCKVRMRLIFNYKHLCCQTGKFTKSCKENPITFLLFLLFLILNFGCTAFLSYYAANNSLNFRRQYLTSMVVIVAFAFLGFTAIVTVYYFLFDFFIEKIMVLQGYQQKLAESTRYSRNQVIPENIEGQ